MHLSLSPCLSLSLSLIDLYLSDTAPLGSARTTSTFSILGFGANPTPVHLPSSITAVTLNAIVSLSSEYSHVSRYIQSLSSQPFGYEYSPLHETGAVLGALSTKQ